MTSSDPQPAPVRPVARLSEQHNGATVWTYCPGCGNLHPFTVRSDGTLNGGATWQWNGDLERPTFEPSMLDRYGTHYCEGEHDPVPCEAGDACEERSHAIGYPQGDGTLRFAFMDEPPPDTGGVLCHGRPHTREPAHGPCHSFLRDGQWTFLDDSAHELAGQTVPMVPLPARWA